MMLSAPPAPAVDSIDHAWGVPPERGRHRAGGGEAMLLALPLLLCLHAFRLNELVDVVDHRTLQNAEGVICCRCRPQRGLRQTRRFYLAPVQAGLHSLSL